LKGSTPPREPVKRGGDRFVDASGRMFNNALAHKGYNEII
jgi:hypothetical protein